MLRKYVSSCHKIRIRALGINRAEHPKPGHPGSLFYPEILDESGSRELPCFIACEEDSERQHLMEFFECFSVAIQLPPECATFEVVASSAWDRRDRVVPGGKT
jgi:hypothetical protein